MSRQPVIVWDNGVVAGRERRFQKLLNKNIRKWAKVFEKEIQKPHNKKIMTSFFNNLDRFAYDDLWTACCRLGSGKLYG